MKMLKNDFRTRLTQENLNATIAVEIMSDVFYRIPKVIFMKNQTVYATSKRIVAFMRVFVSPVCDYTALL